MSGLKIPDMAVDAISSMVKERVIRAIILKLGIVATGPWGMATAFAVGVLWDKIIEPEIQNIVLEGDILLIKGKVMKELQIKLDAKTQEELINALRNS
jgi:hypothetical protein